ncbi:preprotein translocase subunit SecA [bacterium]|nr:preprotein translocase subunit SecA [bacterium]
MITTILAKIVGTRNQRELKKLQPIVAQINSFEKTISQLSNEQLQAKTIEFKERYNKGETLDELLPEAFAVVRETTQRLLGQRPYDVQLIGGIVLHQGKIAEMKTGEGKTLTATLPLYLNALSGKTAFLVTVNDYLVRRDAEWMGPIFSFLGLTVGTLQNSMNDTERKSVYASDIVYATNNELGFDYLRDNMKFRLEDYVQRELAFAIVDEVDSILIDEARTPLIISGSSNDSSDEYQRTDSAVKRLIAGTDYEVDEKQRSVLLTESGNDKLEAAFGIQNLYAVENINLLHHATQALKAHALFKIDVEYVVRDGEVLIVDEFTGRILPGRRYSDGLHQAIEAKEGVDIEKESQTLASITLQNFFRLFGKLAGMTGTAQTEAEEFLNIYKLDVVSIPTHRTVIRQDKPDLILLSEQSKFRAIVEDIKERYKKGQPVLIGTIAIEKSEALSNVLTAHHIPHEVLNAKQHAREAEIIENAGQAGKITIATNMAGRGTDIKLSAEARDAGGLYILGTERHESRRIDNQLRGRSGRQGDAGESRFYISLEDDLIRIFAGQTLKERMQSYGMTEDEVIESKFVSSQIEHSQEKVEKHNFEIRKHLLEYDDVMNQHRKVIYQYRRNVLEGMDQIYGLIEDMINTALQNFFARYNDRTLQAQEYNEIIEHVAKIMHFNKAMLENRSFTKTNTLLLQKDLTQYMLEQYSMLRKGQDPEHIGHAEKWLMLETIDQAWKQHMLNLDHLKEGINLRSWGNKNPLIEYKKESFIMFKDMMEQISTEIVHAIFRINIEFFDAKSLERKRQQELAKINMITQNSTVDEQTTVRNEGPKIGRNDDCPCGSGKKHKKCCG